MPVQILKSGKWDSNPQPDDWKSPALPLSYFRKKYERVTRIELASSEWQSDIIPLYDTRNTVIIHPATTYY